MWVYSQYKNNKNDKWSSREVGKLFQWALCMREKYMKTCSVSLISKGIPIKTTVMLVLSLDKEFEAWQYQESTSIVEWGISSIFHDWKAGGQLCTYPVLEGVNLGV